MPTSLQLCLPSYLKTTLYTLYPKSPLQVVIVSHRYYPAVLPSYFWFSQHLDHQAQACARRFLELVCNNVPPAKAFRNRHHAETLNRRKQDRNLWRQHKTPTLDMHNSLCPGKSIPHRITITFFLPRLSETNSRGTPKQKNCPIIL